ncbi:MAG: hypothetical protein JWR18_1200 [Segetibacter sp.]|nr:hypothetical protein [Segetibacter sp.]
MRNKTLNLFLVLIVGMTFTSCIKNNITPLEDGIGSSFITITQSPENKIFFSPFTEVRTVPLLSVKRDVASSAELNNTMTVKVEVNSDSVKNYNTAHGTKYEVLPDSLYTLGAGVTKSGNVFTMTLNTGEFQKDFNIALNGAKWDLSRIYALAFKVVDPGGLKVLTGTNEVITLLSIKNQYDGIYSVESGNVQRYTAPGTPTVGDALNGTLAGNPDVTLSTAGPTTVLVTNLKWGSGSGSGVAGIDNLQATVNPATNLVTMKALGNATLTNWEGKVNRYDPATKTFYLSFIWNPTANVRTYEIVLKYKGPR